MSPIVSNAYGKHCLLACIKPRGKWHTMTPQNNGTTDTIHTHQEKTNAKESATALWTLRVKCPQ